MSSDHYVSRFHLREFCDPASIDTRDPWLWVGSLADGSVRRRAPKNIGSKPDMFSGAGALRDADAKLETFLANEIEGPASRAFRDLRSSSDLPSSLPPPIMRYLAW